MNGKIDEVPLGPVIETDATRFRVFAPNAENVEVRIYVEPEGGTSRGLPMMRDENGIWSATSPENLTGRYYTILVDGPDGRFEAIDPYSRCNTAHDGRGLLAEDFTKVTPAPFMSIDEAIIYETHIRDFTIESGSGKYSDFAKRLPHLKELGVNTVQIMPIQDFDNDEAADEYNWGYMPFHYFSPDGAYATRRDDGTRVHEVKEMIDAIHRKGLKVVLDVVYNHTAEGSPDVRVSFNALAPGYYYRVKENGEYWNGSGCGNEFRTEAPMARKVVLDSLAHWLDEYHVDGFRFDLMGLIDAETIDLAVALIRARKPDALIYGEPWSAGETPIEVTCKGAQRGRGFGVFNDTFRDALRGSTFDDTPGYLIDGRHAPRVKRGIIGSITDFTASPVESINYIESHDNRTLWDKLEAVAKDANREERVAMQKLGAAITLTSQGLPFLHSGQEMLRTKGGDENSYAAGDEVNMIHWSWKDENRDVFEYHRGLIALRKAHPMFRMKSARDVKASLFFLDDDLRAVFPPGVIGYLLNGNASGDSWQNALVLFNPNATEAELSVPVSKWIPVVSAAHAGTMPIGDSIEDRVMVPPRSAAIYFNEDPGFFGELIGKMR